VAAAVAVAAAVVAVNKKEKSYGSH
jgi:hypothetical protein